MKHRHIALCFSLLLSPAAFAVGLFDPGLNNPTVRTDYESASVGVQTPLQWDSLCQANNQDSGLPVITPCVTNRQNNSGADLYTHSGYFAQSNFFQCSAWNNLTNDCTNASIGKKYWSLLMNNEPWHVQSLAPPNQSLPRARPGEGTMGFVMNNDPAENIWRAHLVNNNLFANPHPFGKGAIPFLGFALASKGNGGTLGYLNDPYQPSVLSFTSKIWDAGTAEPAGSQQANTFNHYTWVFSEWGGKRRGLFMNIFWGDKLSYGSGLHVKWNWQAKQSFERNGGDLALFNLGAESNNACPGLMNQTQIQFVGEQRAYAIDLTKAFSCASNLGLFDEPLPTDQVAPIVELGFAAETSFYNAIWASVHGIHLDPVASACLPWTCIAPAKSMEIASVSSSPFIRNVSSLLSAECTKRGGCAPTSGKAFSQEGLEPTFVRDPSAIIKTSQD